MSHTPHIGSAIRYIRHTRSLKIELVAMDAGCAASNLSRIENGRQNPSLDLLQRLARAMDVSLAELFSLLEAPTPSMQVDDSSMANLSGREWLEWRRRIDTLTEAEKRDVLQYIQQLKQSRAQGHASGSNLHYANLASSLSDV